MNEIFSIIVRIQKMRTKIPFYTAASTTASFNIGVNIQEALAKLRRKRCVNSVCPNLACHIGFAALAFNDAPLANLLLILNKKTCRIQPQKCPLKACKFHYYLKKLSKSLPGIERIVILGPYGNVRVKDMEATKKTFNEKRLKQILLKLNNDFDAINREYQYLQNKMSSQHNCKDCNLLAAIQNVYERLDKKREEIILLLKICKQVLGISFNYGQDCIQEVSSNTFSDCSSCFSGVSPENPFVYSCMNPPQGPEMYRYHSTGPIPQGCLQEGMIPYGCQQTYPQNYLQGDMVPGSCLRASL